MRIAGLSDLARKTTPVFPAVALPVARTLVHHNLDVFDAGFASHLLRDVYVDRLAACEGVDVVALPPAVVDGHSFMTLSEGAFVKEQCRPWFLNDPQGIATIGSGAFVARWEGRPVEDIDRPSLLVARYGETTWGHWLAELLPRAVVAEAENPGFYSYLVPDLPAVTDYDQRFRWSVLRSLQAYGLDADRLIFLSPDRLYRCAALFAVTSVWSQPRMMHPAVLDRMRGVPGLSVAQGPADRVFLVRDPSMGRTVLDEPLLVALARRHGFVPVEAARLTFDEQVALFRRASRVVAVLGSDLTGLLYAPDRVGVLSLAPDRWGDRFFFALVQLRGGSYADVRGTPAGAFRELRLANFTVEPASFVRGLDALV